MHVRFCFLLQEPFAVITTDDGSIGLSAEFRLYTGLIPSLKVSLMILEGTGRAVEVHKRCFQRKR